MLSNTLAASLLLLLTPTVLAAPTRTHCSCKVVYNSETLASPPPPSAYTPSAAHWTPSNPSQDEDSTPSPAPIPVSVAVCASLGSELERFRHTEPELYDLYMGEEQRRKQQLQDSIASKPLPTAVLLRGDQEKINPIHNDDHTSRPSQPQGRIVCFASTEPVHSHEYQTSHMGLCALQLIVVLSIIACVVEGLQLCRSFIKQHFCSSSTSEQQQEPQCFPQPASHSLRLGGSEKRLLAIPETHSTDPGYLCSSPGADKKLRAYENGANVAGNHSTTRFFVQHGVGGRREFIAYDDDSDDEVNRPVM